MPLGDAADDRQPEPAARLTSPRPAVEAVEDPRALGGRDSFSRIADGDEGHRVGAAGDHIHPSAARRVAQRIADQVGEQDAQRIGVAADHARLLLRRCAEIDPPRLRQRQMVGNDLCRELPQVHRLQCRFAGTGLEPRQRQQLLHRMGGALQAILEIGEGVGTSRVVGGPLGQLYLQRQCRQWRAQLVRGVGNELALLLEGSLQPQQEVVQRHDEGQTIEARSAAYPEKSFDGIVTSLDSRVDPVTRAIIVRAEIPNPERLLKPGMLLAVEVLNRPRESLTIAEISLSALRETMFVYRVDDDNVAREISVRIGGRRSGEVEVLEGLSEGDRIVTDGLVRMRDGVPVAINASTPTGG